MKINLISAVLFFLMTAICNAQVSPGYQSRNFQYLTGVLTSSSTTSNVANAWNSIFPPKYYTMNVTTSASGWTVVLEGSLDNSNWQQLSITNSALGTITNSVPLPMLYFRTRASSITANTSVTATVIGVP